jgi:hypothetical protein
LRHGNDVLAERMPLEEFRAGQNHQAPGWSDYCDGVQEGNSSGDWPGCG